MICRWVHADAFALAHDFAFRWPTPQQASDS